MRCAFCNSVFSADPAVPAEGATVTNLAWSRAVPAPVEGAAPPPLSVGTVLSERYEIIKLLGQGGMGTVYKARDLELDRLIAVKVIRPELSSDQKILKRFKQELILARQITHKNVIRIFDLGSHENVKYITMEYVEGRDLSSILDERRLSMEEVARIIRQVCRALEAAHTEGVIHRDLKPQNIMVDSSGRVRVMDFGLARSVEMSGLTQTAAIMGTPAYMSPEQARSSSVDARSDLFSLGIIFYELLTGKVPFKGDTVWATLLARTQQPPAPPVSVDPAVALPLSDMTMRCLAIDPAARYQTATEVAADLDAWLGDAQPASIVMAPPAPIQPAPSPTAGRRKWLMGGGVAVALLAIAGGIAIWKHPAAKKPNTVRVLVADFTNHTGDPVFDNTLEPMFNIALEGASFISAFNRGEARRLARQLPHATEAIDEQSARLIGVSQGLGAIVTGSLSRRGDGYRLSVEAIDAVSGNTIANSDVTVPNKDQVSLAIPKLAAPIRKALGDSTSESVQLEATRGTFTAASLEAVHQYGIAMEQQFAGKMPDALASFKKAADLDPNFGRAYSGMAAVSRNLGRRQDAEEYFKLAMAHVDHMTERERYRTRGLYYATTGNLRKCVEEYSALVNLYPSDNLGHNNLANCYVDLRNMPKAVEEARRAVEIVPSAMQRMNLSLYAAYAGDFQTAEREARKAQELNAGYDKSYLTLAYAQLGQGQLAQAEESYRKMEKISPLGASLARSGLGDTALYEGRFAEAVKILESGAAAREDLRVPEKLVELAYTLLAMGQKNKSMDAAQRAVSGSEKVNIRFLAARVFAEAGEASRARSLSAGLAAELNLEPQVCAKLIEGELALQQKDPRKAIQIFADANRQLDTWIGRFDLGRAYLEAGLFTEADSEFDGCIRRRGEALELDDAPTYGYFPPVYYYQGRVREGLKSAGFADSYRTYLSIRGKAGEDPLLPEIHKRLGQ